ncbi:hypothetical protein [Methylopila sp. M107]|uniref:hypothetical protein n=1 Tax=Methylopila sp. M107 TaxID=1101190 RepID=UPI00036305C6|nr:hypothetical protein [Methylopila sp. M107]
MSTPSPDFDISVPAWRARRLRAHLAGQVEAGRAARGAGEDRRAPRELAHRAEVRRWLFGWDAARPKPAAAPPAPTPRQIAKIERWQAGTGRLRGEQGALRRSILEAVADELLSARPLARGAIAAAHRETVRRCREAGLPSPKASRYRRWLAISRGV